jgi:RNA polymerase sigma-70 factor (ECF subfamily)
VKADDREYAAAARDGDEEAFAALVRRHSGGLHRTVARILSDEAEAWDVVQMSLLKAWQQLDRYNPRWSFATWLYRIGTNLAIDLLRARDSRRRAHKSGMEHRLRLVEQGGRASDQTGHHEVDSILSELVGLLTPQQRAAFVMREVDGMATAEVAEVLACSATTVRNHIFQARKVLRKELQQRFPEYLPAALRGHHAV